MDKACVYCLGNRQLADTQVLMRRPHAYLCAPRGQLVEGFLAIAPHRCIGCLTQLPAAAIDEVMPLQQVVRAFYASAYGAGRTLFYEQGRAGGGAQRDAEGRFPLHAHLCSLPVAVDLQAHLAGRYLGLPVPALADLAGVVGARPYLYVEQGAARVAYVGRNAAQTAEIEGARLKPVIAGLMGLPGRGDWRTHPGDEELLGLLARWRLHRADLPRGADAVEPHAAADFGPPAGPSHRVG